MEAKKAKKIINAYFKQIRKDFNKSPNQSSMSRYGDIEPVFIICESCKHYHNDGTCDAFPDGIPYVIMDNHKHDERHPIQENDILFEWKDVDWKEYICGFCIHFIGDGKCAAFPDGIPYEVPNSGDHERPRPYQQNNLTFKLRANIEDDTLTDWAVIRGLNKASK